MSLEVVFLEVLNTSLLVSMIACVIMIIRVLFKRVIPKAGLYLLWSIVLIRLVVPISIPSPMSLFNAMPQTESVPSVENETFSKVTIVPSIKPSTTPDTKPELEVEGGTIETIEPDVELGETEVNPPTETKQPQEPISLMAIISYVWLAGTGMLLVGLITWYTITYLRLKRAVRVSQLEALNKCKEIVGIKKDVSIYVSDLFSTPVVFGLIKPKIIVPKTLDLSESQSVMHMLTHELVHIKRFDHVTKLLSQMLLCVHWFNPFMWLSYRVYEGDMESSCDESVLRLSGDDIRGDYATSLLNLAKQQQDHTMRSSFVAFGESDLKKRVKGIMGYKSRTIFSIVTAVLIIGLVGCSLLTNPVEKNKNSEIDTPEVDNQIEEDDELLNEVTALNSGGTIEISFAGYEIVPDPLDPAKEGISIFFERKNTGTNQVYTKNVEGNKAYGSNTSNLEVSYGSKILDDMSYGVPAEQEIYPPEYKNVYGCAWEANLSGGESDICYMFYPYEGDGEYVIKDINKRNDNTYLSINISEDTKVDDFYAIKYSKEEGIYSIDGINRSDFETKPYLETGDKISIVEDGTEDWTVSYEGYEVIQDRSGRKGIAFFFNETNIGDKATLSGGNFVGSKVFYKDISLAEMRQFPPYGAALTMPEFKGIGLCSDYDEVRPGESRTCYQYYSYVDSGEYLISLGTVVDGVKFQRIVGAPYKSYLVNVE